jgi:isopentenyl-diphosphate delta-isomerase type 1
MRTTDNLEELFVVVDEKDNILGYKTRRECHSDKSLIHRSVGVVVCNSKGEIALQKRSMSKDLYPGFYALSASGHVSKGETYEEAIKREMLEEIGIEVTVQYEGKYLYYLPQETEFIAIFTAMHEGPFTINQEEVESIEFVSKEKLKDLKDKLTPSSKFDLEKLGLL